MDFLTDIVTSIVNDELKEVLTEEQTPFYDGFENLRKFKIACCGNILDPNVMAIIKELPNKLNVVSSNWIFLLYYNCHFLNKDSFWVL